MKNVGHILECLLIISATALFCFGLTEKAIYTILLAIYLNERR